MDRALQPYSSRMHDAGLDTIVSPMPVLEPHRPAADFEVTVEYPAYADEDGLPTAPEYESDPALVTVPDGSKPFIAAHMGPAPAPVEDIDTAVCSEPTEIRNMMAPAAESLIADAEAILAAFRKQEREQETWAQRMAMQVASLPSPPAAKRNVFARAVGAFISFADRVGGAVVDGMVGAVQWVKATAHARRARSSRCATCSGQRHRYDLYFVLPQMSAEELGQHLATRNWEVLRGLATAHDRNHHMQLTVRRCRTCTQPSTLEVTCIAGGKRHTMAVGVELTDDEGYFVLSLGSGA